MDELGNRLSKVQLGVVSKRLDSQLLQEFGRQLSLLRLNHLHDLVMVSIGLADFSLSVDIILNVLHSLLGLLGSDLFLHLDLRDFSLRLSLDPLLLTGSLSL